MVKTELRDCRRRATPEEVESAAAAAPAAEPDDDADAALEARLARIRSAGASRKRKEATASSTSVSTEPETVLDFRDEKVFFEGPPSRGDLAVNIALGATLLWLPLTFAAIGRAAWLRYRITDKRISIISTSPVDSTFVALYFTFAPVSFCPSRTQKRECVCVMMLCVVLVAPSSICMTIATTAILPKRNLPLLVQLDSRVECGRMPKI